MLATGEIFRQFLVYGNVIQVTKRILEHFKAPNEIRLAALGFLAGKRLRKKFRGIAQFLCSDTQSVSALWLQFVQILALFENSFPSPAQFDRGDLHDWALTERASNTMRISYPISRLDPAGSIES